MAIPGGPSRGRRVGSNSGAATDLVDKALSCYAEWRADADAATFAYRRWVNAASEGEQRFAAYTAALDQEEAAATAYARSIANFEP